MRRYKRLWREAERDRAEADASSLRMAAAVLAVLDALDVDDHPNPEVRGMMRQLRRTAREAQKAPGGSRPARGCR